MLDITAKIAIMLIMESVPKDEKNEKASEP